MSETFTYLRQVATFWGLLGTKASVRFTRAIDDLENEKYTPQRVLSDTIGLWDEAFDAWKKAAKTNVGAPPKELEWSVPFGNDNPHTTLDADVDAGTELESHGLQVATKKKAGMMIAPSNVVFEAPADGKLYVELKHLNGVVVKNKTYRGPICRKDGGAPIGMLNVKIT